MSGFDVRTMTVALRRLLRAHGVWVALLVAMLFTAAPGVARAQATCAIDFSVSYNATNYAHVMSMTSNFDEFSACDPRYIANPGDPASGFTPYVQNGTSANGGSFSTQVNAADDTIRYTAPTGFSGTDTFTVFFCNDINCSGAGARVATVTVTVGTPTIAVNPASLLAATVGVAYSQTLTGSGGQAPYGGFTVISGALPAGLTLAAGGALTGTPTAGGSFNFTIRTTDSTTGTGPHNGSRAYTMTVNAPTIAVSPAALPAGTHGNAYSQTITATGGTAPYSFAVASGTLPAGLTLSAGGGLTGTPTVNGSFLITITATDSSTGTASPYTGARGYTLVINAPPAPVANAVSRTVAYNSTANAVTLNITGGAATSVATPGLPAHGTVDIAGTSITYTPTTGYAGPDSFTYTASNASGASAAATVTITVSPPTVAITSPAAGALPSVEVYGAYSETFTATGGLGPRTFALTAGALPPGLGLTSGGSLSGTPTTPGTYNFTVTASDSSGAPGPYAGPSVAYSLTVTPSVAPDAPVLTTPFNGSITADNTPTIAGAAEAGAVVTVIIDGAAAGTAIVNGSGAWSYVPPTLADGAHTVRATATDGSGNVSATSATANFTVDTTAPAAPVITMPADGSIMADTTPTIAGTAEAGTTVTIIIDGVAAGTTTAAGAGAWSFVPAILSDGAHTVRATATDASGNVSATSATMDFTVDATAPSAPVITAPADGSTMTDPTPTIAGTAEASATLTITIDGAAAGFTTANGSGAWSFVTAALADGAHTVDARAMDSSGNVSVTSFLVTFTVDTTPLITITSPAVGALPSVEAYAAGYSQTFTATGGVGPHSFALAAGALPPGMSFTSGGVLSGAPTTPGTYNFSITASDSSGAPGPFASVPVAYSVTVTAPTIALSPAAGALTGRTTALTFTETFSASGGAGPYSYSLTTGALPPGVSLSSSGILSGAPTAAGTYNFTVTAQDSHGFSAANAYSITISDPVVTMAAPAAGPLPGAVAFATYSQTFTATGGAGPRSFAVSAGALPPGLSLAASGLLSGAPTTAGTFSFSITASDSSSAPGPFTSAPVAYDLIVAAPTVTITAPAAGALPDATASAAYSQTFTAAGGSGSHSFSVTAGGLPPGLSLSGAGVLSGTPTTPGTYSFTLVTSDASGAPGPYASQPVTYSLTVIAPTVVITSPAAGALSGVTAFGSVNQTFTAVGGSGPHTFALAGGALPAGVSLTSAGVLSGAPTTPGTYNFSIAARDSSGAPGPFSSTPAGYSLVVSAPMISFTPSTLADGTTGQAYAQALTASGGTAAYGYSLTAGALPPGIALAAGGALSGTPTAAGTFAFTITVADANGFTAANAYSLLIIDAAPVAGPDAASTPANQAVEVPVTANDTGVITSVAVAGAPAHGTAVVNGLAVAYTPAAHYFGVDSFTYAAAGPGGTSAPATVTVTVTPLAVPTAAAQVLTVLSGQSGSVAAITGSTGAPITAVAVAAGPVHGAVVVSGQDLVYTPAAGYSGADSFTYTLTNPFGVSAPATVTVTVDPVPITAAPITVEILAGQTASVTLTADAAGGPFTAAALVSLTPATAGTAAITNPAAGQYGLTFTPTADFTGTVTATYTLSNAFATSATGTVTVIVTARPDPTADPEVTGLISAQSETARRFATAQISNINSRLESLRDGGGAGASLQLSFSGGSRDLTRDNDPLRRRLGDDDNWTDVLPGLSYGGGLANEAVSARAAGTDMSAASGRFGLWAAGGIDFGHRDATTGQKGLEFDTDGLTAGADLRVSDQFVLGASVGWGHDESRIGDDGTRSDADGYSYAVYGSYQPGARFFVDGLFGYGTLNFDSRRYITASGDFAYGERDGSQWFGAVTGGWDMRDGRRLLSPYGRLSATQSDLGAYSETTGGVYALAYESQTARTLTGTFGLRGAWSHLTSFGEVVPRFRFEYSHDFQGSDRANLFYVDWVDGPVYGVDVDPLDQNRVLGGIGLDVLTLTGSRFSFEYEATVGSGAEQHQVRVRIESRF